MDGSKSTQEKYSQDKKNLKESSPYKDKTPSINLPKGGGAIRGIDEKFSVNPATGTASLSVPIFVTPNRSDFYPKLSLSYDSGAGNGPFGLGWNLSVPSITRKTDKGLPKYQDAEDSDIFILSGSEDLVPKFYKAEEESEEEEESSDTQESDNWVRDVDDNRILDGENYIVQQYRPRIEGLFARIERWEHKKTGNIHWEAITKDNIKSVYGKSTNSKISDPDDDSRVFKWLLEESYDDKGNVIHYEYKQENQENIDLSLPKEKNRLANNKSCSNKYLKSIKYGNMKPFERNKWHFIIVFDYGEHDFDNPEINEPLAWSARMDAFSSYRSGFEIRTKRLCRRVLMFHHFPDELGDSPYLVRSTDFCYNETPIVTYLKSITQIGYMKQEGTDDYQKKSLPPLEFTYARVQIDDTIHFIDAESLENLPIGLDGAQYQWVDLDGEGISGILTDQGNAWFYKRNLGDGRFASVECIANKPSLGYLRTGQVQFMDLAGDGQKDLVFFGESLSGFYERTKDGHWESFIPFSSFPNINWDDSNLRFIDLNGDGHTDILISGDNVFTWYPSKAEQGFGSSEYVQKSYDEEMGPTLVFADGTQSIYLADMCGDGLNDIVRIKNGEVCYWSNLGYGRFSHKVTMDNSPYFDSPDQFFQQRIHLADIDGSGTTDIIYIGGNGLSLYFNQTGNGWSEPHHLTNFPSQHNLSSVMVVDLLGNGTACVVWSSPLHGDNGLPMRYIDLMGGKKPHLLQSVKNNMGAETKLQYASSIKFYLEDFLAGKPWITKLPFPVHLLEQVETRELITDTKFVSLYKYHHGYFDGEDREFRGFGMVEQWDTESFAQFNEVGLFDTLPHCVEERLYALPVYTKTWFHTGFYQDRNNISQQYIDEYYNEEKYYNHEYHSGIKPKFLDDTILPFELNAQEMHEACRALKGRILRREIYGLDQSDQAKHPYRIIERNYQLQCLQPIQDVSYAVFYVHECETLDYYYERDPRDPRVNHRIILEVDKFGNVIRSIVIGYPRREPVNDEMVQAESIYDEQKQTLITYTESKFINKSNELNINRIGIPYEVRTYEITGISPMGTDPFKFSEVMDKLKEAEPIQYEEEPTGLPQMRLIESTQMLYYKDDLSGPLPLGEIESLALSYETYQMVFTFGLIEQVYGSKVNKNLLKEEGRYIEGKTLIDKGLFKDQDQDDVWWIPSGKQIFDNLHFYLPIAFINPFDQTFTTTYDSSYLLISQTKDPLDNCVTVQNNYRIMLPELVTDPNGNRSAVQFDELGMEIAVIVMGKEGNNEGDTLEDPTTQMEYNLFEWKKHQNPNFVHTLTREQHGPDSRWQESYIYSDGLGREIMTKIQAEPGLAPGRDESGELLHNSEGRLVWVDTLPDIRWIGTGRTIFNNKGNRVKQYEPFFSTSLEYEDEDDLVEWGVTPIFYYDPLGRLIQTDKPNGTFSKVEFKVWQQVIWDENDTVIESQWYDNRITSPDTDPKELRAAELAAKHAETPIITHLDVMERIFLTIAKNSIYDHEGVLIDFVDYPSRVRLDIEGNTLETRDAGDRRVMSYEYNMLSQQLEQESVDAGILQVLNNVAGNPIRTWDSRSYKTRSSYDALQRLMHLFVSQDGVEEHLVKYIVYGEDHHKAEMLNLRGNIYQQYDGVGVVTNEEFDFKGNLLRSSHRLAKEYKKTVNWQPLITLDDIQALLEDETFSSSATYDALNRPTSLITPHTTEIPSTEIRPTYNEANLLDKLDIRLRGAVEWTSFITNINYNAKGQRELISYGNGICTKYSYDPDTFRLKHLETTRGNNNRQHLQDLDYTYDPVGNIMEISDNAQRTIFYNNAIIKPSSKYEYDAIYRLIQASGREHISMSPCHYKQSIKKQSEFIQLTQSINNGQALRNYIEKYAYDKFGNLTQIRHIAGPNGNWRRDQTFSDISNRLNTSYASCEGSSPFQYPHDANGNITKIPHLQALVWNYANQLKHVDLDLNGNKAYYSYNAEGQRVRKVIEKGHVREERIYLGNFEIYRKHRNNNLIFERQTLHIMDDQQRIVLIEIRAIDTESSETDQPEIRIRYQLSNHLGSSTLEVDDTPQANIISYEEYFPYGGTSYICGNNKLEVKRKRYRYNGKERDDETGLYYYGARYYAAWLGRWVSCDPAGFVDGVNLFQYTNNNPINFQDNVGTESENVEYLVPHSGLTGEETVEERVEYLKKSGGIEVDLTKEHEWQWNETEASWEFRGSYTLTDETISESQSIPEDEIDFIKNIESAWEQGTTAEKVELVATGIGALGGLIPYIGDYISLLGSSVSFFTNPSWEAAGDVGLDTIGAILPFCPALGTIRRVDKLTDIADVAHDAERIVESGKSIERVSDVTKTGKRTSRMVGNPGPFPTSKNTELPKVRGKRKKKPKLGRPGKAALQSARRRWFKDRVQHLKSKGTSEARIREIIQGQIIEQKLNPNSKIYSRLLDQAIKSTRN